MASVSAQKVRSFIKREFPQFPAFSVQKVGFTDLARDEAFFVYLKVWDARCRELEPEIARSAREALGVKVIVST